VIKENGIALFHRAQIVPRLKIADACPRRFAVLDELRPRVSFRFRFNEPVIHKEFTIADLRFTIAS
jgi:hypothetical protein